MTKRDQSEVKSDTGTYSSLRRCLQWPHVSY